jgi:acetyl esterase
MADVQALVPLYLRSPEDATNPYASPILAADPSGLRPAHTTSAESAMLRDDGERYVERLRQAGVPVTFSLREGHVHDSAPLTEVMASARAWRDEVLVVLRRGHEQAAVPRS